MVEITVYSKPGCHQCKATVKKLDTLGLAHNYVDVTEDETGRAVVEHLGYQRLPVVLVGDMHWSGLRVDNLNRLGKVLQSDEWARKEWEHQENELSAIEYLRKEMGWHTTP